MASMLYPRCVNEEVWSVFTSCSFWGYAVCILTRSGLYCLVGQCGPKEDIACSLLKKYIRP